MNIQEKYTKDKRIRIIFDISEFASESGFNGGVLYPYDPFTADDIKEINEFVAAHISLTPPKYRTGEFELYSREEHGDCGLDFPAAPRSLCKGGKKCVAIL